MKKVLAVLAVVGLVLTSGLAWATNQNGMGTDGNSGNGNGGTPTAGGNMGNDGSNGNAGGGGHGGSGGGGTSSGGGAAAGGGVSAGAGGSAGTSGGASVGASVSAGDGPSGATGSSVSTGASGYGDREHLIAVLKVCTWDRLATYDTTATGGWSVRTFDDVQWPIIYRCMKAHGYQPNGADYTKQTNFGSR